MLRNVGKGLLCLRAELPDVRIKRTPVPTLPTPRENLVRMLVYARDSDIRSGNVGGIAQ